jgi:flagellar hook protein FlgE
VWTANFTENTPSGSGSTSADTSTWAVTITDANGNTVGSGTIGFIGSTIDPNSSMITINNTPTDGAAPLAVTLDFSGVTSYSAGTASTIATSSVDGNAAGTLSGITITSAGQVQLTYSNGQTALEGSVAMASFQDPQLLERLSNGLYQNTKDADVQLGTSAANGLGTLESGELETSNVNLSNQFSLLILIERGYQACSEVLSISNEMIQQLFGIRGQGG